MNRFLQLHLLTHYGPANLNRDDSGRPKTVLMGGSTRLRVSSQSLKRAWRTSDVFAAAFGRPLGLQEAAADGAHTGTRTKRMGVEIYQRLRAGGIAEKRALEWAADIAARFGKLKKADKDDVRVGLEIEQLAHFSPEERSAINALLEVLIAEQRAPQEADLAPLRAPRGAVDIALFGRMLADTPAANVEAAAQVAHAIAVHKCTVEDDYFTAVDDLNRHDEDAGAGHVGETEFGAAVFYLYLCIDRELLLDNLGGDRALAGQALAALLEAAAKVAPTGKQNSFASRARASYVLAEKGDDQPRQLSVAFLKAIAGSDLLTDAIAALRTARARMDQVYGPCAAASAELDALSGEGSLADLQTFAVED